MSGISMEGEDNVEMFTGSLEMSNMQCVADKMRTLKLVIVSPLPLGKNAMKGSNWSEKIIITDFFCSTGNWMLQLILNTVFSHWQNLHWIFKQHKNLGVDLIIMILIAQE